MARAPRVHRPAPGVRAHGAAPSVDGSATVVTSPPPAARTLLATSAAALAAGSNPSVARAADNTRMPDQLKSGIEQLSGMSLDAVKVHYNSSKPAQLNALAYAQGSDIHIGPGQEKQLPHESWHVVQQADGRAAVPDK